MYKKGDLEVGYYHIDKDDDAYPQWVDEEEVDEEYAFGLGYDARTDDFEEQCKDRAVAYLPHSCDSWVIGTADEVEELIAELQLAVVKMRDADD